MGGGDSTLFPHFGERMIVLDVLSHPVELVILQSVKKKNVTHTTISRRDILEGTVYLQFRFRSCWICPNTIGGDSTLCPHFGERVMLLDVLSHPVELLILQSVIIIIIIIIIIMIIVIIINKTKECDSYNHKPAGYPGR